MSQTVQRAITILEFIAERPRTVVDVAADLDVHRTTALRLLQTLQDGGLVRQRPDGRYGVGFRLSGLAQLALDQFDLASLARPHLERLEQACSHTIHLAATEGDAIVYVDKIEPVSRVRMHSQVGRPVCLHTAGVSKAILAFLPDDQVERLLADYAFDRHTGATITSGSTFRSELADIRERGWAVDDAEFEDYVNCIAAPVHGPADEVVAAVSVTALRARADLDALREILPTLLETTATISRELGRKP